MRATGQPWRGVDKSATVRTFPHGKVQVRARRSAVAAHIADKLPGRNPVPSLQPGSKRVPHMSVFCAAASFASRMIDHDPLTIALSSANKQHPAACAGVKGGTVGRRKI